MRVAFDTNVLVSALLIYNSPPSKALNKAEYAGEVLYSLPVLNEIDEVLSRPKFRKYINETQVTEFLSRIYSTWLEITIIKVVEQCRDPKDDKFLELAVNGRADFLISGDADLLSLKTFRKTRILSPAEFLDV